jgi:hypothetical protein
MPNVPFRPMHCSWPAVLPLLIIWTAAAGGAADFPKAKWLENGMIDAGGSHEPLSFVTRVGGGPTDARERYEHAQSEEVIRRLKEQGVEIFHTHLYKGFGMAAEMPEMEDALRAASIAHRYGLKVDTYIQWASLQYETFFAEEPAAKNWIQRDASGQPISLSYGFEQSFRYLPCFSNPSYLEYLKKVVRYAVERVKTDFIHFDNFEENPEPESCHCTYCTRGFRAYLKAKYPPSVRRERFGFENLDYINPPIWNAENPADKMEAIRDPVIQEWVAFRCQQMADALGRMAEFVRSLSPDVAIEINPNGLTGENRPWTAAIDLTRLLKWTDAFWTEEPNVSGFEADGRLVSRIRSFKLARAFGNILLSNPQGSPVAIAENLAFGQTIGLIGSDPLSSEARRFLDFYRRHRELYQKTEDDPTVAVLRSYPSITYHSARAQLGAILVEQALIQSRIPFRLIVDEQLADLSRYKVLVLPESECLSDAQLTAIAAFVRKGGGLVALGDTGLYDEWLRVRPHPGLADLLPSQAPGKKFGEAPVWQELTGPTLRTPYGQGRAAYVPGIEFDGPNPPTQPYFATTNDFWKSPKNSGQILEAVNWAARESVPVEVGGPAYLVANLVSQPAGRRWLLHLVNYNAPRVPVISSVDVVLKKAEGRKPGRITVISPETADPLTLSPREDSAGFHFTIPEIRTYSVVVVDWQ